MWGALKKDFGEFVSTVATETTETLQTIDRTLDEPIVKRSTVATDDNTHNEGDGDDANRNRNLKEALIDPDTGLVLDDVAGDDEDEDDDEFSWKSPDETPPPTADEMRERLVTCEDVFKDPLVVATTPSGQDGEDEETEEALVPAEQTEGDEPPAAVNAEANKPSDAVAVRAFLDAFDVASKTEEISKLLDEDIALKTTFSMVATDQSLVSYADFWTRYFYRIAGEDETRLLQTYTVYYEKQLAAFQHRKEEEQAAASANNLGTGFSSFFGGVVNRLTTNDVDSDDQPYDTSGYLDLSADQTAEEEDDDNGNGNGNAKGAGAGAGAGALSSGLGGFLSSVTGGGVGRPPFVMNTAVSDDDDDNDDNDNDEGAEEEDDDEDDEDSEVELGWDDDDDDDDDEGFDKLDEDGTTDDAVRFRDDDDRSETVDFKDAEKEGLLEQLEQARAERDALQKTVEMQAEELKKTRLVPKPIASLLMDDSTCEGNGNGDTDMQRLKMQLFEKDSELAALRAKLEDVHEADADADDHAGNNQNQNEEQHRQEIERLTETLADKDREIETLRITNANDQDMKMNAMTDLHNKEMTKLREQCQQTVLEKEQLQATLQSRIDDLERNLASHQEQAAKKASTTQATTRDEAATAALTESLIAKDREIASLQALLGDCQRQISESADQHIQAQTALRAELESQVDALVDQGSAREEDYREKLQNQDAEYAARVRALDEQLAANQAVLDLLKVTTPQEAADLQTRLAASQSELEAVRAQTNEAHGTADRLRSELDDCKAKLAAAIAAATTASAATNPPSSPGSISTGVQIQLPAASTPALEPVAATPSAAESLGLDCSENGGDDDGDDGWGDDW